MTRARDLHRNYEYSYLSSMSERYKVIDSSVPTFITSTLIGWIDLFTKPQYTAILDDALNYAIEHKGLRIHAYVYMTSHIHLIATSSDVPLNDIMRDFKKFTAKRIVEAIKEGPESRREWLLDLMQAAANRIQRNQQYKVWQDGFHPVILDTQKKLEQRFQYIHNNPLQLQLVDDPGHWVHSSYRGCLLYTSDAADD